MSTTIRQDAEALLATIDTSDREFTPTNKRPRLIEARDRAAGIVRKIDRVLEG